MLDDAKKFFTNINKNSEIKNEILKIKNKYISENTENKEDYFIKEEIIPLVIILLLKIF